MNAFDVKEIRTRIATTADAAAISEILVEAANWMAMHKRPLWSAQDLAARFVEPIIAHHEFLVAQIKGHNVGVMILQWSDPEFWQDRDDSEAGYLHKLAVRRHVAGQGIPAVLMDCATQHVKQRDRKYLRLDCDLDPRLCAVYERLGFERLDTVTVSPADRNPFTVARYQKHVR